ncbi:MAG: hypothetical protein K2Z81_04815 [Cyanobacteria bacterium]|nr:hypothetical protein [Cyanobacteriota bacterium]
MSQKLTCQIEDDGPGFTDIFLGDLQIETGGGSYKLVLVDFDPCFLPG